MAIINSANLKWYYSGGSSNADPNASLGGGRSQYTVTTGLENLFDNVSSGEAGTGDVEYRCVFFRNEDANANGLIDPVLWIYSNTPSASTTLAIGVDPDGKNSAVQTIASEGTAPTGVSFTSPSSKGAGISLPSAPYDTNDYIGIWIRRTVDAGTLAASSDSAVLRVEGDSV